MKCAVANCENSNEGKACKLSFFTFPSDVAVQKRWIKFCGVKQQFNPKSSFICMEHFTPEDFANTMQYEMGFAKNRLLKRGAVPSLTKKRLLNRGAVPTITSPKEHDQRDERQQKRDNKKLVEAIIREYDLNLAVGEKQEVLMKPPKPIEDPLNVDFGIPEQIMQDLQIPATDSVVETKVKTQKKLVRTSKPLEMNEADEEINDYGQKSDSYTSNNFIITKVEGVTESSVEEYQNCMNGFEQEEEFNKRNAQNVKTQNATKACEEECETLEIHIERVQEDSVKSNSNKNKNPKVSKKHKKLKKRSSKETELFLNVKTTEPSLVLDLLDRIRPHPILWFIPPQYIFKDYRKQAAIIHKEFIADHNLTIPYHEFQKSIQNIVKWYMGLNENENENEIENENVIVIEFEGPHQIQYYNKCAEFLSDKSDGSKVCEICQASFSDYLQWLVHKREEHIETKESTNFDYINHLNKMKDYIDARWHYRIRQGQILECKLCNGTFIKYKYLHHMKVHANLKEFVCDICGKAYMSKSVFEIHRRRHTGPIKRVCLICGKSFNDFWLLTCHRKKYHRPIEGTIEEIEADNLKRKGSCLKGVSKYKNFIHPKTQKRRFICDYCGHDYFSVTGLLRHMKQFHQTEWQARRSERQARRSERRACKKKNKSKETIKDITDKEHSYH